MSVRLRDLLIFVTLSDELTTRYSGLLTLSTLLLLELTELQRIKGLKIFYSYVQQYEKTGEEQACDGPDIAQTKDVCDKTGELVSDMKI